MNMTNFEWMQQASKEELAEELKKIAHWNPKERVKAEFHYKNFYEHWLEQPHKVKDGVL